MQRFPIAELQNKFPSRNSFTCFYGGLSQALTFSMGAASTFTCGFETLWTCTKVVRKHVRESWVASWFDWKLIRHHKAHHEEYPTLSRVFSADVTFNIMASLWSQTVTFKWKLCLLLLRVKRAVETERSPQGRSLKRRRNPSAARSSLGRSIGVI